MGQLIGKRPQSGLCPHCGESLRLSKTGRGWLVLSFVPLLAGAMLSYAQVSFPVGVTAILLTVSAAGGYMFVRSSRLEKAHGV
jgi:hypothetical protein